jgi:hypothetical protein
MAKFLSKGRFRSDSSRSVIEVTTLKVLSKIGSNPIVRTADPKDVKIPKITSHLFFSTNCG